MTKHKDLLMLKIRGEIGENQDISGSKMTRRKTAKENVACSCNLLFPFCEKSEKDK
jgi:hypothetical protein